jgi:primosomal protein N' (replication factor Y)
MTLYAEVALPLPLDKTFTYAVPAAFTEKIAPGMRALVPFGGRTLMGFVVGLRKRGPGRGLKLKSLAELPDESPVFSAALLAFTRNLGRAFLIPWGEVLKAAVPPSYVPRSRASYSLTEKGREALEKSSLAADEREVAGCLGSRAHTLRFLERTCRESRVLSALERLQRHGLVAARQELKRVRRRARSEAAPGAKQLELDFSLEECGRRAAEAISRTMESRKFGSFLLFGAWEARQAVYFELIRKALADSGRVLYLIPEISLTPALTERLEKRLGQAAAVLHGGLTEARREGEWQKIKRGDARVIVGSRLVLFAPVDGLRLVICDEEQDESYLQQEGLAYDVRSAVRLRAEGQAATLVFGSSAPSVETFYRAVKAGNLLEVRGDPPFHRVTVVPHEPGRGLVSPEVERAVKSRLERRQPVILFANRRGYASSLICPACGFLPRCSRCGLPLSFHKREGKFVCHYCRFSVAAFGACPKCGGRLVVRQSVGVEAVAEDLKKRFPGKRVEIFAADEAGTKEEQARLRLDFRNRGIDILVGTRFLAHQVDFPRAALVGILHPEFGLRLADHRSAQKTYLAIVRELRFVDAGEDAEALVQTSAPEHFSVREATRVNYRAFYEQDVAFRRLMGYPPFSALADVQFMGDRLRAVGAAARRLAGQAREAGAGISVFGPALARAAKGKGLYRAQIVLKARTRGRLHRFLVRALEGTSVRRSVVISD